MIQSCLSKGIAHEAWVFDIAYQHRWGDNLGKSTLRDYGYSMDLYKRQLIASLFYRF